MMSIFTELLKPEQNYFLATLSTTDWITCAFYSEQQKTTFLKNNHDNINVLTIHRFEF